MTSYRTNAEIDSALADLPRREHRARRALNAAYRALNLAMLRGDVVAYATADAQLGTIHAELDTIERDAARLNHLRFINLDQ